MMRRAWRDWAEEEEEEDQGWRLGGGLGDSLTIVPGSLVGGDAKGDMQAGYIVYC